MNINTQKTEDDSGYGTFVIGGMDFSTICKSNEAIGYLLGVEFAWVKLLMEVMGGSVTKARGIHYGTVWAAIQVAYYVLDSLEDWF